MAIFEALSLETVSSLHRKWKSRNISIKATVNTFRAELQPGKVFNARDRYESEETILCSDQFGEGLKKIAIALRYRTNNETYPAAEILR